MARQTFTNSINRLTTGNFIRFISKMFISKIDVRLIIYKDNTDQHTTYCREQLVREKIILQDLYF